MRLLTRLTVLGIYFIFSLAAAGDLGGSSAKNEEEVVGGFSLQQPGKKIKAMKIVSKL